MTRRDVAAMRLAYEHLRGPMHVWDMLDDASSALTYHDVGRLLRDAIDALGMTVPVDALRLIRARLALLLRALLRADAGDFGRSMWTCDLCGQKGRVRARMLDTHGPQCFMINGSKRYEWLHSYEVTPLWSSTPYIGTTLTQPSRTWSGAPERRE